MNGFARGMTDFFGVILTAVGAVLVIVLCALSVIVSLAVPTLAAYALYLLVTGQLVF